MRSVSARQRALVADIEHPAGKLRAVSVHLDPHSTRRHRRRQISAIADHLDTLPSMPTVIGGDWNTTGFDAENAVQAILCCAVRAHKPKQVAQDLLPHPERAFERELFIEFHRRGFEYLALNEIGTGTIHYDLNSVAANESLREWVPRWCFPLMHWAASSVGGRISARVDWFAGRGLISMRPMHPLTISNLCTETGEPISDHDAITVDLVVPRNDRVNTKITPSELFRRGSRRPVFRASRLPTSVGTQ